MSFSEALIHAHSNESNEPHLIATILHVLDVWEEIESLSNGSDLQRKCIDKARGLVDILRTDWNLSNDEIVELDEHSAEFRQWFESPPEHHRAVS